VRSSCEEAEEEGLEGAVWNSCKWMHGTTVKGLRKEAPKRMVILHEAAVDDAPRSGKVRHGTSAKEREAPRSARALHGTATVDSPRSGKAMHGAALKGLRKDAPKRGKVLHGTA
jgi:hypothetical protein